MKISIGCDHAGFEYKKKIVKYLEKKGHKVTDHGTFSLESVDYPDFVHPVARDIEKRKAKYGILICGSGNGVAMTANKHQKVRAALCWKTEIAKLAREHNDANAIAIPARYVSSRVAIKMVKTFIKTDFEGGRHKRRVKKISC